MKKLCLSILAFLVVQIYLLFPLEAENWYATASYLFWRANENNLDFAQDINPVLVVVDGKIHTPDFKWDSGFKVGLGTLTCAGWDLSFNYTWFRTKASGSVETIQSIFARDGGSPLLLSQAFSDAFSKWRLRYQTLDLEIGYPFIAGCMNLRPHFGARGAWITDHFSNFYTSTAPLGTLATESRQKTTGVGPRVGFFLDWNFWGSFSLLGEGAFALLWVHDKININESASAAFFPPDGTTIDVRNKLNLFAPVIDLRISLGYSICSPLSILLKLGWETHYWSALNQTPRFAFGDAAASGNGNLNLGGLILSVCSIF
jgi:hypothetical protein